MAQPNRFVVAHCSIVFICIPFDIFTLTLQAEPIDPRGTRFVSKNSEVLFLSPGLISELKAVSVARRCFESSLPPCACTPGSLHAGDSKRSHDEL